MREMKFLGTTTVGERGQIVIPAEARSLMKLEKGEKLLVFSHDNEELVLAKFSKLKAVYEEMEKRQGDVKKILEEY